jgi:hypothetical protein
LTQLQILQVLRRELGGPPILHLPLKPVRWLGARMDRVERALGRPSGWEQRISKMGESTHFNGRALDALLDYRPPVPLEEAIALTARRP